MSTRKALSLVFLWGLLFLQFSAAAQKQFSGTITYACSYEGETAEFLSGLLVEKYSYDIDGCNMIFKTEGGLMSSLMGPILILGKENKSFMLDEFDEIAYEMVLDEEESEDDTFEELPKLVQSNEEILGYQTNRYEKISATDTGDIKSV